MILKIETTVNGWSPRIQVYHFFVKVGRGYYKIHSTEIGGNT